MNVNGIQVMDFCIGDAIWDYEADVHAGKPYNWGSMNVTTNVTNYGHGYADFLRAVDYVSWVFGNSVGNVIAYVDGLEGAFDDVPSIMGAMADCIGAKRLDGIGI